MKFLIVGTGRCGSSFLSAIIAKAGGSFEMPAVEHWGPGSGAFDSLYILKAYKWYIWHERIANSLLFDRTAGAFMGVCRRVLRRTLLAADYIKSPQLVWLVHEINRFGEPFGLIAIYRKFSGYWPSVFHRKGSTYQKSRDIWMDVNNAILLQASLYPSALISYEELIDTAETHWAEKLHTLTKLPVKEILSARKELLRPSHAPSNEFFEDNDTRRLYEALRNKGLGNGT